MEHSIFAPGAPTVPVHPAHFCRWRYAGDKIALAVWRTGAWKLEIVKRSHAAGFEVDGSSKEHSPREHVNSVQKA